MKAEVNPSGDPAKLAENLSKRAESVERDGKTLVVELEDPELLSRVPGIDSYTVDGSTSEGLGGSPIDEEAYVHLDSREDAVRAFLATVEGYQLVVLSTGRDWDLRALRRYNPDIKQLSQGTPPEFLEIEKSVGEVEGKQEVGIELPGSDEVEQIYRRYLT